MQKFIFASMEFMKSHGLSIQQFIDYALAEDTGDGDHTSLGTITNRSQSIALIKSKEDGIICGLSLAEQIFGRIDNSIITKIHCREGDSVYNGQELLHVEGSTLSILKAERLVLNCMQRMSGIATLTRKYTEAIADTPTKLLDTRKTTPNFRSFEKWAVKTGGGLNHRFGLYDMILIKDNHIDACGGIASAINSVHQYLNKTGRQLSIEVETRSLDEIKQVLAKGGVKRIMLDNFAIDDLREAVQLIDHRYETEASGGINLDNIRSIALTGVDFISVGALTHSYKSLDISLKIIS